MDKTKVKLNRTQAVRDQAWARARDMLEDIEAYIVDESNDPIGRICACIVAGDLRAGDYLTSTIRDPNQQEPKL